MGIYTHNLSLSLSIYICMYAHCIYILVYTYVDIGMQNFLSHWTRLLSQCAALCKEWDREAKLQLDFLFFVSMTPLSQYIGTDEMGAWTQLYFRDKIDKLKALFLYVVFRPSKG